MDFFKNHKMRLPFTYYIILYIIFIFLHHLETKDGFVLFINNFTKYFHFKCFLNLQIVTFIKLFIAKKEEWLLVILFYGTTIRYLQNFQQALCTIKFLFKTIQLFLWTRITMSVCLSDVDWHNLWFKSSCLQMKVISKHCVP